jgi:hypothetical protein
VKVPGALLIAVVAAVAAPADSSAALYFLFGERSAAPNDRVTVRTGATPRNGSLERPVKPLGQPIRLYLVRSGAAAAVRSRFDSRVEFVGSLVPDGRGRGVLAFSVPPLDAGTYTLAFWCPACAPYSRGRSFFVQDVDQFAKRYRSQALLRISTATRCPVTVPNGTKPPPKPLGIGWHGNGLLWTLLAPDGIYAAPPARVRADGSILDELRWATRSRNRAPSVSGRRLKARAPPLRVLAVRRRSSRSRKAAFWAIAAVFPAPGCWRITARVADIRLTYALNVVVLKNTAG